MTPRPRYVMPEDKKANMRKLALLEWANLGVRFSIVTVLYLVMGNSQAMKAAWLEDVLTLVPPIAFLISLYFRKRTPDKSFPYGYQRVTVIAFLCGSVVLTLLGLYLLGDSLHVLIKQERTSIGGIELFGDTYWQGWLMIAGLLYSVIPPFFIGRIQEKIAATVHEKTVYVDAKVSKADWMTGVAGIVGILGVGLGWWWADAVAALVIGLDVTLDGYRYLKEAIGDLLDRRPHDIRTGKPETLAEELEQQLESLAWVTRAAVRLREEGNVISGEAFVIPDSDDQLVAKLAAAREMVHKQDWRLYELVIIPVAEL